MSKQFLAIFLFIPFVLSGCGEGKVANPSRIELLGGNAPVKLDHPPACFCLDVPWICQAPPGPLAGSHRCGEACAVSLGGYFNHGIVSTQIIIDEDNFLAQRFNDQRYLGTNGWYTDFGGRNELGILLREFHALNYSTYNSIGGNVDDLLWEAYNGHPTFACVMIKSGTLVSSGGVMHWVLVVGWDGVNIVLIDPGTNRGNRVRYSLDTFRSSWARSNYFYAPVRR